VVVTVSVRLPPLLTTVWSVVIRSQVPLARLALVKALLTLVVSPLALTIVCLLPIVLLVVAPKAVTVSVETPPDTVVTSLVM
jgi:hypothetical protein